MQVEVVLPAALASAAGGEKHQTVDVEGTTVGAVLDALTARHPLLGRRIRDETGAVRRFVNVYVDDSDIRHAGGLDTPVREGSEVRVLPSVAGG